MSEFGTVNNQRDLYREIETLKSLVLKMQHEMKSIKQEAVAKIISRVDDKYTVEIDKEKFITNATLSNNATYWREVGYPDSKDIVRIKLTGDLFNVIITEKITGYDYNESSSIKSAIPKAKRP